MVIGASLSEPHTSEFNGGIFIYIYIYIYIICRTSFRKCKLTLLTRIQVRMEYRSRFPESSSSFGLDTTFLNMDSQSRSQISAGARRSATAQKRKEEASTSYRDIGTKE